jgi:Archaeal fructose-1,6-bisphosphatase and related enzymes of inositol monophosphatase family
MASKSPVMTLMMRASEKAARSLIRDFGEVENLQVSKKGPGDFVSAADRRAEEIIYEELKKARPDYSFLMEESGAVDGKEGEYRWIIDPLDGTTNFLHGIPHWAISIALEHQEKL